MFSKPEDLDDLTVPPSPPKVPLIAILVHLGLLSESSLPGQGKYNHLLYVRLTANATTSKSIIRYCPGAQRRHAKHNLYLRTV